jgi:co-chaperonin GroES (HSP10)
LRWSIPFKDQWWCSPAPVSQPKATSPKEKPQQGKVLAVGPGRLDEDGDRIPMEVKVGDTVVYAKYAGTSFKTEGSKEILFLKESDILAILGNQKSSKEK